MKEILIKVLNVALLPFGYGFCKHVDFLEQDPVEYRWRKRRKGDPLVPHVWLSSYSGLVHRSFGLTYASYFVAPRVLLQSMPTRWQARFIALLSEMHSQFPEWDDDYAVQKRDTNGRFVYDPLSQYRHPSDAAIRACKEKEDQ